MEVPLRAQNELEALTIATAQRRRRCRAATRSAEAGLRGATWMNKIHFASLETMVETIRWWYLQRNHHFRAF